MNDHLNDHYLALFKHMSDNHGLTLLDSEIESICQVVRKMPSSETTREEIEAIVLAEFKYWHREEVPFDISIGAVAASANIFAALKGHFAPWHPAPAAVVRDKALDMTDAETKAHLLKWCEHPNRMPFSWPTDACGYDQHIKFVTHRNENWNGRTLNGSEEWIEFVRQYAIAL